jgi:uncharacterized protein
MAMKRVLDRLIAAGIEDRDMQTSSLGLWPVYDDQQDSRQPVQAIGFRVANQIQVTLRDIQKLGQLLDGTVGVGVTNISGPSFTVAEPEPLLEKARDLAIADARRKAQRYAKAAEVTLGNVIVIEELGGNGPGPVAMRMQAESFSGGVPIASGESMLAADVSVTFALK